MGITRVICVKIQGRNCALAFKIEYDRDFSPFEAGVKYTQTKACENGKKIYIQAKKSFLGVLYLRFSIGELGGSLFVFVATGRWK